MTDKEKQDLLTRHRTWLKQYPEIKCNYSDDQIIKAAECGRKIHAEILYEMGVQFGFIPISS